MACAVKQGCSGRKGRLCVVPAVWQWQSSAPRLERAGRWRWHKLEEPQRCGDNLGSGRASSGRAQATEPLPCTTLQLQPRASLGKYSCCTCVCNLHLRLRLRLRQNLHGVV